VNTAAIRRNSPFVPTHQNVSNAVVRPGFPPTFKGLDLSRIASLAFRTAYPASRSNRRQRAPAAAKDRSTR
jgi:hypothetical protein